MIYPVPLRDMPHIKMPKIEIKNWQYSYNLILTKLFHYESGAKLTCCQLHVHCNQVLQTWAEDENQGSFLEAYLLGALSGDFLCSDIVSFL